MLNDVFHNALRFIYHISNSFNDGLEEANSLVIVVKLWRLLSEKQFLEQSKIN